MIDLDLVLKMEKSSKPPNGQHFENIVYLSVYIVFYFIKTFKVYKKSRQVYKRSVFREAPQCTMFFY